MTYFADFRLVISSGVVRKSEGRRCRPVVGGGAEATLLRGTPARTGVPGLGGRLRALCWRGGGGRQIPPRGGVAPPGGGDVRGGGGRRGRGSRGRASRPRGLPT